RLDQPGAVPAAGLSVAGVEPLHDEHPAPPRQVEADDAGERSGRRRPPDAPGVGGQEAGDAARGEVAHGAAHAATSCRTAACSWPPTHSAYAGGIDSCMPRTVIQSMPSSACCTGMDRGTYPPPRSTRAACRSRGATSASVSPSRRLACRLPPYTPATCSAPCLG